MTFRPYRQLDVFTDTPGFGNPLAVVLDARGLSDETMQRFARWTNLSETTFVLPPTDPAADYLVRIFTPGGELSFAGHPTLGTCHAWLRAGGNPRSPGRVVQQCGVGLVELRADGRLAFAAPPVRRSAPSPVLLDEVAAALDLRTSQIAAAQMLDNGPAWLGLLLADVETVLALRPDHRSLKELRQKVGVAGITSANGAPLLLARSNRKGRKARTLDDEDSPVAQDEAASAVDLEVRAFAAPIGVDEDPVTGSLNASLAQWLIADGYLPARYVAGQGQSLGRDGRVFIDSDASGQVWVGGHVADCVEGRVAL